MQGEGLFPSLDHRLSVCSHHCVAGQVAACKHKSKNESVETHNKKGDTSGLWTAVPVNSKTVYLKWICINLII